MTCALCPNPIEKPATGGNRKYCDTCAPFAKRLARQIRERRARESRIHVCQRCKKVEVPDGRGYCPSCRVKARKANSARYELKRNVIESDAPLLYEECLNLLIVEMIRQCPRNEDCETCIVSGWCIKTA